MAINPSELPSFDMDFARREYDPGRIAEEVIWPLVDAVWWDDWRQRSHVGNEWHIIKRGARNGELVDVILNAFQDAQILDFDEEPDESEPFGPTLSTAILEVEPILTDERRDIILDLAAEDNSKIAAALERHEAGEKLDEDEQDDDDPEVDIEDLTVKINFSYKFYSDGEYMIESGKVVEDIEGIVIWCKDEDEDVTTIEEPETVDEDDPETVVLGRVIVPKILDHDMEMLETGLYIFNSPDFIIKAFQAVRANPIVA